MGIRFWRLKTQLCYQARQRGSRCSPSPTRPQAWHCLHKCGVSAARLERESWGRQESRGGDSGGARWGMLLTCCDGSWGATWGLLLTRWDGSRGATWGLLLTRSDGRGALSSSPGRREWGEVARPRALSRVALWAVAGSKASSLAQGDCYQCSLLWWEPLQETWSAQF